EAWAHRVHANAALLQVRGPCPRERTHGGFGGAINTRRQPFTGDDGRIQDDGGTIRHERKRLLHREQEAFHIDVEDRVIVLLSDLAEGGIRRDAGIREHNIEPALLPLDSCEEAIKIAKVRHVSLYAAHISFDLLDRRSQLRITTPRDEDVRAFAHKQLGRREANAAIAASDECDFSFKLPHIFLLSRRSRASASYFHGSPSRTSTRARGQAIGPNQAPLATAQAFISPNAASAALSATKTYETSPLHRRASQPPPAAIASRVRFASSGQASRPAPCDAKYSAMPSPKRP